MVEYESTSDTDLLLAGDDNNALTKLRAYLNNNSNRSRFNLRPLAHARVVRERNLSGYIAHLSTLRESRWVSEAKAPYFGDEVIAHRALGNIWDDYQFDQPTTTLLDGGKFKEMVYDLKETQHREPCSKCQSLGQIKCRECFGFGDYACEKCQQGRIECCQFTLCRRCRGEGSYLCDKCMGRIRVICSTCLTRGYIPCPDCAGFRFVLVWTKLHIRWENHESIITLNGGNSNILPISVLKNSSEKSVCFQFDDKWNTTQTINNIFDTCWGLSHELQANICKSFQTQHHDKSGRIIRLFCMIEWLHIKQIDYTFGQKQGNIHFVKDSCDNFIHFCT
ncbi:unnamed protein product [Adineta steineri]|uniref:Uncharacterized protein n=2 Tax=Adineta steineri TaxID=433720 RepID=A0A815MP23_9BILA|nr:unnamed protein product [Adineta steineri]